jgi:hypothetical protein
MVSTFLCWLMYVTFFLFVGPWRIHVNSWQWLIFELLTLMLGLFLALALKSPSRALTLLSGLLMGFIIYSSVNY